MTFEFSMRKMLQIPIYGISSTYLTSSAAQCKIMWFWYFFGILANLGRPVEGQILKFMKNRYEIRSQHAKNVGNSHLWVF